MADPYPSIEQIVRDERPRVLATLIRILGDFDLAEDATQSAFIAASKQWREEGIPNNPRAWLISVGRLKAIDTLRREARFTHLADDLEHATSPIEDRVIEDDCLRLIFTCCHPGLPQVGQVALTLREVCGLTTEEIGRAFLTSPTTVGQRIVRAKAKIRDDQLPYELPDPSEMQDRLAAVLRVAYLVFNEGYYASSGYSLLRPSISQEGIRLARLIADLMPSHEVLGLLALMLLSESRRHARATSSGDIILLPDQDRSLWNREMIEEALEILQEIQVEQPYAIQAAISAVHAQAASSEDTNWNQIVSLYDRLAQINPSPVIDLNRAVAISMRDGAEKGLRLVDKILEEGDLADYSLAHSARADFCRQLGRTQEAIQSYEKALELTQQEPERRFLQKRLADLAST